MEEFDYELEHRMGEKMKHVNALNRIYMITREETEEETEAVEERDKWKINLMLAQANDLEIQECI